MLDSLPHDLRYGARMLRKSPAFTAVAVLSLALGIGVNTTIFSVVNAVLLRPLAIERPDELVHVYTATVDGYPYETTSYPDFADMRRQSDAFAGMAVAEATLLNLAREVGPAQLLFGMAVSGEYFEVLGVGAEVGRTLTAADDVTPGGHPIAVLGHNFWQRHFNGDEGVVGRTVKVNGQTLTVVGVLPAGFNGTFPLVAPDIWTPMSMQTLLNPGGPDPEYLERRGSRGMWVIGRLRAGVTVAAAEAQLDAVMARLAAEYPDTNADRTASLLRFDDVRIHPFVDGAIVPVALLLMGLVSLVLLIACANVANLLLSRADVRRQEIAVRMAMGAGRGRLLRQLLTESTLLGLAGGALGLLMAYWTTGLLLAFQPPIPISMAIDLGIDGRVLGFALVVGLLTGMLFGLAPALQSTRPDLVGALKDQAARGGRRARRFGLRNLLVVSQVAVSLVLLVAAGLLIRSVLNVRALDPGFETERIAMLGTATELVGYDEVQGKALFDETLRRVRAMPGVDAAAFTDRVPVGMGIQTSGFWVEGYEAPDGGQPAIDRVTVGLGYFETLGIPLVAGRAFRDSDHENAPSVVVVNEALASRFWPGDSALGKRIGDDADGPFYEVVGVVRDYKVRTLGEEPRPYVHFFNLQEPGGFSFGYVLVRTEAEPAQMVERVRRLMLELEPELVFLEAKTMAQNLELTTFPVRMGALWVGAFGFLALGLAAVGLYGVVAYSVAQRTHEIGVRIALGAATRDVLRLVVGQGMGVVGVGVAIGLALAGAVSWTLSSFLYGIDAVDPLTFGATAAVLLGVALAANLVPARRAAAVDPIAAVRAE